MQRDTRAAHVAFAWLCVAIHVAAHGAERPQANGPPNIVLIISDDQAYSDFGFMGNSSVKTPHLDRLAARSARFPNGYLTASVCRPSLATLLTGLYQHQHGIHFNHPPPGFAKLGAMNVKDYRAARAKGAALIERVPTLPRLLAKQGYLCFQAGKHWEGDFRQAGFTHGMTLNEPVRDALMGNRKLKNGEWVAHGNGDAGLAIGRTSMQPVFKFIDRAERQKNPFFIWYAPFLPHTPHDAPERIVQQYRENEQVPRHMVRYYASITHFDETVGALIDQLKKKKLARNTVIVFIVDNGWRPDRSSKPDADSKVDKRTKRSPFELGLRTPILIHWEDRIKPAAHAGLVSSVDIMPTLLAIAGVDSKHGSLPGRNLLPVATGEENLPDRPVFGAVYPGDATSIGHPERDVAYRWVRHGEDKLIIPHVQRRSIWRSYLKKPALFNVVDDPKETKNLYGESGYKETAGRLEALLNRWWLPKSR